MTEYFVKDKSGKITFSEDSLKALLDRVYNQGYNDGKNNNNVIWNSPLRWSDYYQTTPFGVWCNDVSTSCTTISSGDSPTKTSNVTLTDADLSDLHVK